MTQTVLIMLDGDDLNEDFSAMIATPPSGGDDLPTEGGPSSSTLKTITGPRADDLRLAHRRLVLAALADSILENTDHPPFGPMAVPFTKAKIEDNLSDESADLAAEADERVSLLSGIGGIIIRGEDLDLDAINQRDGVTAIPDMFIPMVNPVETQADSAGLSNYWHLEQIGLHSAQAGGEGIVIGVLDTGIDGAHPEFEGKTIYFQEFDEDGRKVDSNMHDWDRHGTHVCSVVAGKQYGVAPDAALAVAAVVTHYDDDGRPCGKPSQVAAGINWLVETWFGADRRGVDIINASIGLQGYDDSLVTMISAGKQHNIPTIAAIGNNGQKGPNNHTSPGNYKETMGVGASDIDDIVADFSDWGKGPYPSGPRYPVPNISAPGVRVKAAIPGGAYARFSGTSQAAPIVTGVAARWMSDNPACRRNSKALFGMLKRSLNPVSDNTVRGNKGGRGRVHSAMPSGPLTTSPGRV